MNEQAPVETAKATPVDIERFSRNVARIVEQGGKALAAYLKPREDGQIKAEVADEVTDAVKTLGQLAQYWLSDPQRAVELQSSLAKAYLDLWATGVRRLAGEEAQPVARPTPRTAASPTRNGRSQSVLRFPQASLSADDAMGRSSRQGGRGSRRPYQTEGRVLRPPDRQRGLAVELRADQPGAMARDAEIQRRKPRARHAHAGRGHRGRPRQPEDPPVGCREIRGRPQPRGDARQGRLPERPHAAHPVCAEHRDGA